jgi:hypothetical protein
MFCFVEDEKIISGFRKKPVFKTLTVVMGCRPGDNLLSPSMSYMFGFFTGLFPSSSNFPYACTLSYYFYIVRKIYNT